MAIVLHALIDHQATYPPNKGQAAQEKLERVVSTLLSTYFEQREQVVDPPPLLTGQDLIKVLDLSEGKLIGLLLARLKEAQATAQDPRSRGRARFCPVRSGLYRISQQ